jgi:hypothetical protein
MRNLVKPLAIAAVLIITTTPLFAGWCTTCGADYPSSSSRLVCTTTRYGTVTTTECHYESN